MKTFAIITDIHGNSPALKAVLDDIASKDIDRIFCLGDLVGIGPDSNQVLEMLIELKNISFVIGNHDMAVISAYRNEDPPKGHHFERAHHKWLADRIDPKYINFMSEMPRQIIFSESSRKFLFVHYHLNKENDFIAIDKEPTIEKLNNIYADFDYDVVCFGHHHFVHRFKSREKCYFNPGALGCYDKPLARYGITRLDNNEVFEELFEIPYDNLEYLRSYEKLEVPERDFILKVFYGGQI
jgi:putative phosphoesterase